MDSLRPEEPVIKITKVSDGFVGIMKDPESIKISREIFQKFTSHHISSLIRLQNADFNKDFPEDIPRKLMYKPPKPKAANTSGIKEDHSLEAEAEKFIKHIDNKRRNRYTGSYDVDKQPPKRSRTDSESTNASNTSSSIKLKIKMNGKSDAAIVQPGSFTSGLIDCSSSDSDVPEPKRKETKKRIRTLSSSSSESESEEFSVPAKKVAAGKPMEMIQLKHQSKRSAPESASTPKKLIAEGSNLKPEKIVTSASQNSSKAPKILKVPVGSKNPAKLEIPTVQAKSEKPKSSTISVNSKNSSNIETSSAGRLQGLVNSKAPKSSQNLASQEKSKAEVRKGLEKLPTIQKSSAQKEPEASTSNTWLEIQKANRNRINFLKDFKKAFVSGKVENSKAEIDAKKSEKLPEFSAIKKTYFAPPIIDSPEVDPNLSKRFKIPKKPPQQHQEVKQNGHGPTDFDFNQNQVQRNGYKKNSPIRFSDIDEAHNAYSFGMPNTNIRTLIETATEKVVESDKFKRYEESDGSESEDDEIVANVGKHKSIFSEDENEENDQTEQLMPDQDENKVSSQKSESENSGSEVSETEEQKVKVLESERKSTEVSPQSDQPLDDELEDGADYVSLACSDNIDDLLSEEEEEIPQKPREMVLTTELEDLKMTVRKEPRPLTEEEALEEFNRNTQLIMRKKFDEESKKVVRKFFPGLCAGFAEGECGVKDCLLVHKLPDLKQFHNSMKKATMKDVDDVHAMLRSYPKLYSHLFQVIAEVHAANPDFTGKIKKMIQECEKTPRSHSMYRNIVDAIQIGQKIPRYKAIKFLIKLHTNSSYAQEQIMNLILETGPDVFRLSPYFQDLMRFQSIPPPIVQKLMENCVTYQDPGYPLMILNMLLTMNPSQIRSMNGESTGKFIHFQSVLIKQHNEQAAKSEAVSKKIA